MQVLIFLVVRNKKKLSNMQQLKDIKTIQETGEYCSDTLLLIFKAY